MTSIYPTSAGSDAGGVYGMTSMYSALMTSIYLTLTLTLTPSLHHHYCPLCTLSTPMHSCLSRLSDAAPFHYPPTHTAIPVPLHTSPSTATITVVAPPPLLISAASKPFSMCPVLITTKPTVTIHLTLPYPSSIRVRVRVRLCQFT